MTNDNITMAALKEYFTKASGKKVLSKTGFSSATKYSSVTFEDGAYVLGAPEFVLKESMTIMRKRSQNMHLQDPEFLLLEFMTERLTENL